MTCSPHSKGQTMKKFSEFLLDESFKSTLVDLTKQDIQRITGDRILFSKFLKLENGTDAVYGVAMADPDDNESFIGTKVTINAYQGGKFKFKFAPMPELEDDDYEFIVKAVRRWD